MLTQPNHLSTLGTAHTAISVVALLVAFYALFKDGRINPQNWIGRTYIMLTLITCLTGFPIMKTGHFTPGHYLAIIIIVLLPLGTFARRISLFGTAKDYIQLSIMSFTLFLSCIPAIVETMTRLPVGQPLASNPNALIVQISQLLLFMMFIFGVLYQMIKFRSRKKKLTTTQDSINLS
jgi:hypothetical protein